MPQAQLQPLLLLQMCLSGSRTTEAQTQLRLVKTAEQVHKQMVLQLLLFPSGKAESHPQLLLHLHLLQYLSGKIGQPAQLHHN